MSERQFFERSGLIWGSNLPATQRFVLLALNEGASPQSQGVLSWVAALENITGCSNRATSKALEGLEGKKIISWTTNGYEINFDALQDFQRQKTIEAKAFEGAY